MKLPVNSQYNAIGGEIGIEVVLWDSSICSFAVKWLDQAWSRGPNVLVIYAFLPSPLRGVTGNYMSRLQRFTFGCNPCYSAAINLPLLDQAEVEDVEEELPDGLEDVCSQDEEGEEEDGEG